MNTKSKDDIKEYLKRHNVKPTLIRIKVLEYLWSTKEHPDADRIYNEILNYIPTLSRASIYNTLKLFVEKRLVLEIKIEGSQVRYDGNIDRHAHFKCIKCGKLLDVEIDNKVFFPSLKEGKILQEHIYILGICNDCLKKKSS